MKYKKFLVIRIRDGRRDIMTGKSKRHIERRLRNGDIDYLVQPYQEPK